VASGSACDARGEKEIFGPVLTIQDFADDEEGIRWANDVPFGLASSVWTKDIKRGLNAARRQRFGTVWINDHLTTASEMPHGGFKQSGYGKDMSSYSIEDYTVIKHVMAKIADWRPMELMGRPDLPLRG
jgi:acyl-CoA reductase-like NAD-dependent aldehyde dehydrogenase